MQLPVLSGTHPVRRRLLYRVFLAQSCANLRMLPEVFTWNVKPWATPVPAILLQGAFSMVFVNFSFGSLVVLGWGPMHCG